MCLHAPTLLPSSFFVITSNLALLFSPLLHLKSSTQFNSLLQLLTCVHLYSGSSLSTLSPTRATPRSYCLSGNAIYRAAIHLRGQWAAFLGAGTGLTVLSRGLPRVWTGLLKVLAGPRARQLSTMEAFQMRPMTVREADGSRLRHALLRVKRVLVVVGSVVNGVRRFTSRDFLAFS